MEEGTVVIVGAGPSGLATSACLSARSISNIVLEREDCCASLWKNRSYDRLSLHLAKNFCTLPYKNHSPQTPTFMSNQAFIAYIDAYVAEHDIRPRFRRSVELTAFDEEAKRWTVCARNSETGDVEAYVAEFVVVASGENSEGFVPEVRGLESFDGLAFHSSEYKNGKVFNGKDVLVVGCGNSGMEISNDLADHGARTTIVVKSPFHVLSKRMVQSGMIMSKWLPIGFVDSFICLISRLSYGDLSHHGIHLPSEGPFMLKKLRGKTPVIDGGCVDKIKENKIKVAPEVLSINGSYIKFVDGTEKKFDAIIFATGYKSVANKWLKDYKYVLNEGGMPKNKFPHHWKGENGLFCAGFSGSGLPGVSADAVSIANEIRRLLNLKEMKMKMEMEKEKRSLAN